MEEDPFAWTVEADDREPVAELFANLKRALPQLEELLAEVSAKWMHEGMVYRFYHQSLKMYDFQGVTLRIVDALHRISPRPLNEWFMQIVKEGTGMSFEHAHNENWLVVTRPMVEASFHARYFLEMAVRYGKEMEAPPRLMPSGWAALLELYKLR